MTIRRRPSCSPRHRKWCSPHHATLVLEYRDARDAREALRESDTPVPTTVPGAAGAGVAYYQLEAADFDRYAPKVLFKQWLIDHAHPKEATA